MADTIEIKSRVGPDGVLDIHVPLGAAQAGTAVVVSIRAAPDSISSTDPQEWHQFVKETYGSSAGLGVERQPQGDFEARETIE